jgi:DNA-binding response OmpR family regulator
MRIAVVDDDESVIEYASAALAGAGHSCTGFRNGASLLAALRRQTFDLILLDWNLPDSSGIELLRSAMRFRAQRRSSCSRAGRTRTTSPRRFMPEPTTMS